MSPERPVSIEHVDALATHCECALAAGERLLAALSEALRRESESGADAQQAAQSALHGLAWTATLLRALREMLGWAQGLAREGRLGRLEALLLQSAFGEYLSQIEGGVPMSQGEIFRVQSVCPEALATFRAEASVRGLSERGFDRSTRAEIAQWLVDGRETRSFGDPGFEDPMLTEIRAQLARWSDDHAAAAHALHLDNALIPESTIAELAHLGVFGLTVPARWGGSGLGKTALCVVTEELSRGWIGYGSLGTRTEIAAELILGSGTPAQQARWLPGLCKGSIIPAAAFTEPDTGSDLAALRTRAEPGQDAAGQPIWRITGNKTWTTHGARSDLLTLLARTEPGVAGYRGLSMLLLPKPRGDDQNPFPAPGLSGSEIEVLGYRGMKEYEIGFEDYAVPADAILGETRGAGFKQLMRTFESARIQTAARAVGVAQNALELALNYACSRHQFGQAIVAFPRVADKLAWMAVEIMVARKRSFHAAREKDAGRRCDLEAGMAKLLAARVAWAAADNAVQIHGGNGYALEYRISRVLVDARILSVFEGAAEIQAQIIARALID